MKAACIACVLMGIGWQSMDSASTFSQLAVMAVGAFILVIGWGSGSKAVKVSVEALKRFAQMPQPSDLSTEAQARRAAGDVYTQPESLVGAVRAGDVLLVRGTWILQRAGYEPVEVEEGGTWNGKGKITLTHYEKRREAVALPNRQQIEAEHPTAALPAEELETLHAALRATAAMKHPFRSDLPSAAKDGFDAMPIVSASQCWYTRDHPDPDAKTLATIAERLAWLLPQMQRWGVGEVGVFFDWPSLYQDKPMERTPAQAECFKRALDNMSLW
jgi:hypothetical protein